MTDPAVADHASDRSTRRALFGAGVLGAALALAGSRSAAARSGLSDDDVALATFLIGVELAARDLYQAAIDAGADGDLWPVLRSQHASYAQRLAGLSGVSANTPNAELYGAASPVFATSDPTSPGIELENIAAATHAEAAGAAIDVNLAGALASIAAIESRHAAVLAIQSGADAATVFTNPATAPTPEGAA